MTFHDASLERAPQPRRTASAGIRRRIRRLRRGTPAKPARGRSRRPVGRVLYRPFPGGDDHSSGTSVAGRLVRPTRAATRRTPAGAVCPGLPLLFGLAPGGVCPAGSVAEAAGRSYRPVSPLPAGGRARGPAVCFLRHFPWGRPRRALPGTVPPWSPDLPRRAGCPARPSGLLDRASIQTFSSSSRKRASSSHSSSRAAIWVRAPLNSSAACANRSGSRS